MHHCYPLLISNRVRWILMLQWVTYTDVLWHVIRLEADPDLTPAVSSTPPAKLSSGRKHRECNVTQPLTLTADVNFSEIHLTGCGKLNDDVLTVKGTITLQLDHSTCRQLAWITTTLGIPANDRYTVPRPHAHDDIFRYFSCKKTNSTLFFRAGMQPQGG